MEDVLEVYQRPYDGNEVLVCMDETSKQQVKETRVPRPAAPGLSAAYDYEYERNGVSSLFMLFAPLDGWRRVEVRERRTKVDWAHVIKKLVDEDYPDRDRIVLVMDNLNTHKLSSLYEAFEPAEARRIAERLEIHYTTLHYGTWLTLWRRYRSVCWLDTTLDTTDYHYTTSYTTRSHAWHYHYTTGMYTTTTLALHYTRTTRIKLHYTTTPSIHGTLVE